jgi:hypothetical protein
LIRILKVLVVSFVRVAVYSCYFKLGVLKQRMALMFSSAILKLNLASIVVASVHTVSRHGVPHLISPGLLAAEEVGDWLSVHVEEVLEGMEEVGPNRVTPVDFFYLFSVFKLVPVVALLVVEVVALFSIHVVFSG